MVARNIRKPGHRGIRGYFPSRKSARFVAFESRLERDHLLLLEADPEVIRFEEQPVTIHFEGKGGARRYTPDCRVEYRREPTTLVEVKYAVDIASMGFGERAAMEEAHDAARAWCRERGWRFALRTDAEIVGPRLDRASALHAFAREPTGDGHEAKTLLAFVAAHPRITLGEVLARVSTAHHLVRHLLWLGQLRDEPFATPTAATRLTVGEGAV